jgi:hypothetical protein
LKALADTEGLFTNVCVVPKSCVNETLFESEAEIVGDTVFDKDRVIDLDGKAKIVDEILGLLEITRVLDGLTRTTDKVGEAELAPTIVQEG